MTSIRNLVIITAAIATLLTVNTATGKSVSLDLNRFLQGETTITPTEEPVDNSTSVDNSTQPTDNTTIPSGNTTVPSDNTTVPSDNTTIPTDNTTVPTDNTTKPEDNSTLPTPPPSPEENFPEYSCYRCIYLDLLYDDRGCFRNNASRLNDMTIKTFPGCVTAGHSVVNNSYEYEIPDLRNSSFMLATACNVTNEEILIKLMNTQMDVNQMNSSVYTVDLPVDTLDAYLGTVCGANGDCRPSSAGKGFELYETSY